MVFADFVALAVESSTDGGLRRYLIVDTAATRPFDIARSCGLHSGGIDLLTGESCDWSQSASPVLIDLSAPSTDQGIGSATRQTLDRWKLANCFVYLESRFDPDAMANSLRVRTEATLPENLPVLLRYFDARVLEALMGTLTAAQRHAFLTVGSLWATPGRRGELSKWANSAEPADAPAFISPLALNAVQEAALLDAGEADALIDVLLNQNNARLIEMTPPDQHETISEALASSQKFGINGSTDQASFCSLWLELGAGFVAEEPWASALLRVRDKRSTLADALTLIASAEDA